MRVLVLGNGAREHALAWKIGQSPQCDAVYLHPGNVGTQRLGFRTLGDTLIEPEALVQRCKAEHISMVVIGPETLLAEGYATEFRKDGFLVVGPDRAASRLESSKSYAKNFMHRARIPTAQFMIAENHDQYKRMIADWQYPVVLKLDGLAAGKGVIIAENKEEADAFAKRVWVDMEFGKPIQRVVIEKFLPGKEVSYMGLCDGKSFIPLATAQDYKRIGDGDKGPNTGGMGAISPSPFCTPDLEQRIQDRIIGKLLTQLDREGIDYCGVLFLGLMVTAEGDPYVLEFNVRFGDPETQAVLPRLESDFLTALEMTAREKLKELPPLKWKQDASVYVVGAAEGYPGKPTSGDPIEGLDAVSPESTVFFAGVGEQSEKLVTTGGRVLGIGALAADFRAAREKVYESLNKITWRGIQYRTDIGSEGT